MLTLSEIKAAYFILTVLFIFIERLIYLLFKFFKELNCKYVSITQAVKHYVCNGSSTRWAYKMQNMHRKWECFLLSRSKNKKLQAESLPFNLNLLIA